MVTGRWKQYLSNVHNSVCRQRKGFEHSSSNIYVFKIHFDRWLQNNESMPKMWYGKVDIQTDYANYILRCFSHIAKYFFLGLQFNYLLPHWPVQVHRTLQSLKLDQRRFLIRIIWATAWQNQQNHLCAHRRLRSTWASAQSDQSHRWALSGQRKTQCIFMQTAKTLIRLDRCPGWSES